MSENTYWADRFDAANSTDADRLHELSTHEDGYIRRLVARNKATAQDTLEALSRDKDTEVQTPAVLRLKNLGIDNLYDILHNEPKKQEIKVVASRWGSNFLLVNEEGTPVGSFQVLLVPHGGTQNNAHITYMIAPLLERALEELTFQI